MKPGQRATGVLIGAALLLSATAGFPETILVYVEQYTNGTPGPAPAAACAGILDGLFETGHIVFDTGKELVPDVDWATGGSKRLLSIAIEGGARLIVTARVESTVEGEEGQPAAVRTDLTYYVMDALTFSTLRSAALHGDNLGKENEVDASALNFGLGVEIAAEVSGLCTGSFALE